MPMIHVGISSVLGNSIYKMIEADDIKMISFKVSVATAQSQHTIPP